MSSKPTKPYATGDCLVTTGQKISEIIGQTNSTGCLHHPGRQYPVGVLRR